MRSISRDCVQYTGGASQNASIALQAYGYGMGGGSAADPHAYGEDCLTVNVWTKPTSDKKKAVMVWIYGGGKFPKAFCLARTLRSWLTLSAKHMPLVHLTLHSIMAHD